MNSFVSLVISCYAALAAAHLLESGVCGSPEEAGKTECSSLLQKAAATQKLTLAEEENDYSGNEASDLAKEEENNNESAFDQSGAADETDESEYDESEVDEEINGASVMRSDDDVMPKRGNESALLAPLTCEQEEQIRTMLENDMKTASKRQARIIRLVFHDAVDHDNLLTKNAKTGKWDLVKGTYGGVDGCLFSPLSGGDKGKPEATHNKNLGGAIDFATHYCKRLCNSKAFAQTPMCANAANCKVDFMVLGALVTIEKSGGPRIPMTWGRKRGDCVTMKAGMTKDMALALRFAPSLTGIDDAESFRATFEKLGFSPREHAALMGAHSFGKLAVCAGGLNGVEKGKWCNAPAKLDPPLKPANFAPWSKPKGPCIPKYGTVGGGVSNGCWAKTAGGDLAPVHEFATPKGAGNGGNATSGRGYGRGLADGGFFDRTPDTFDNDYYKLFAEETYDGKDVCCGKMKKGECDRGKGPTQRITKRNKAGRGLASVNVPGGVCSISWCRDDRKDKTHMKSTRAWAEPPHKFVKKGYKFGVTKRMIRLAGDWALLANDDTRAAVQEFAKDQNSFFKDFTSAFGKIINKGYTNLVSCKGKVPTGDKAPIDGKAPIVGKARSQGRIAKGRGGKGGK